MEIKLQAEQTISPAHGGPPRPLSGLTRRRLLAGLLASGVAVLAVDATSRHLSIAPKGDPAIEVPDAAPTLSETTGNALPASAGTGSSAVGTSRADFAALLHHLDLDTEIFETIETRYFAGLTELLAWHGIVGPADILDQSTFREAIRRFQRSRGMPETGLPDEATRWILASDRAKSRKLELMRVDADVWPNRQGQDSFQLRQDVADRYNQLRGAVKELGGVMTSDGGFRELPSNVTPERLAASPDYLGLAFNLAAATGMQNASTDPYLITQEKAGWRVWARASGGRERVLSAVFWRNGKPTIEGVKARVIDFTKLANDFGFRGIAAGTCFPGSYNCANWWHFQCEAVLTPFLSQFGAELLSLSRYPESAAQAAPQAWAQRQALFVAERDRESWRFGTVGPRVTPAGAAQFYQVVADQIRLVLREYEAVSVTLPPRDPLGKQPNVAAEESTKLTVRTPYWINVPNDASERARQVARARPALQSAFKTTPANAKLGKGTPAEIQMAVQTAVNTGEIRGAGGVWPPTRADVEDWMGKFGIGVDCSGFVYEALSRVDKALANLGQGHLLVSLLAPVDRVGSRHATQGYQVRCPADLNVGDLVYVAPQEKHPISHVRIIDSVQTTAEGLVFTTAEAAYIAGGPVAIRWRFPDPANFHSLMRDIDGKWRRADEREYESSFWRHLPLIRPGQTTIV